MSLSEEQIKTALAAAVDPNTGKDFVAGKSLKNIKFDGNDVSFDIQLGYPAKTQFDVIRQHPVHGERLLREGGITQEGVLHITRHHHTRQQRGPLAVFGKVQHGGIPLHVQQRLVLDVPGEDLHELRIDTRAPHGQRVADDPEHDTGNPELQAQPDGGGQFRHGPGGARQS